MILFIKSPRTGKTNLWWNKSKQWLPRGMGYFLTWQRMLSILTVVGATWLYDVLKTQQMYPQDLGNSQFINFISKTLQANTESQLLICMLNCLGTEKADIRNLLWKHQKHDEINRWRDIWESKYNKMSKMNSKRIWMVDIWMLIV